MSTVVVKITNYLFNINQFMEVFNVFTKELLDFLLTVFIFAVLFLSVALILLRYKRVIDVFFICATVLILFECQCNTVTEITS